MSLLWLLIGLIPPALMGWLALRLLEGKAAALHHGERFALAVALGPTLMAYLLFFMNALFAVPLSLPWMLAAQGIAITALLIIAFVWQRPVILSGVEGSIAPTLPAAPPLRRPARIALMALLAWVGLRVLAMASLAFLTPTYFDDAIENWNLRAKVFYNEQSIVLTLPWDTESGGVSSYPPAVPLVKVWLSALAGEWREGLVNGVHLAWFFAGIAMVYFALRRVLRHTWSIVGAAILAALPLYLMQGTTAYADVFLSAHVFAAAWMLFEAARTGGRSQTLAHFRLAALAMGLLVFTKNEALILYLPCLLLVAGLIAWKQWKRGILRAQDLAQIVAVTGAAVAVVAGPWLGYKLLHGLTFGNAKSAAGISFAWQPGVLTSVTVNTFFEGNWLLLFPLFLFALIATRLQAFRWPLLPLTLLFLIPYGIQLFLYMFTGLSTEAIQQTGYARGIIHLVPIVVMLTMLLLSHLARTENPENRIQIPER